LKKGAKKSIIKKKVVTPEEEDNTGDEKPEGEGANPEKKEEESIFDNCVII